MVAYLKKVKACCTKLMLFSIPASLILSGCHSNVDDQSRLMIRRYAMVTGLKADQIEEYKSLHKHAWPGVLKKIKQCHIQNYSIYLKRIEGKPYLFSYFEYNGNDFNADMKKMAADKITLVWWKKTDITQVPLPDAASKGKIWSEMEEVFHTQ
jgi:L-rhamnose mutarotase